MKDTVQTEGARHGSLYRFKSRCFRKKTNFYPPVQFSRQINDRQAFALHMHRWEQSSPNYLMSHTNSVEQRETQVLATLSISACEN